MAPKPLISNLGKDRQIVDKMKQSFETFGLLEAYDPQNR